MQAHRKAVAFARTHKKHLIVGHLGAAVLALAIAFLVGVFATAAFYTTVYGTKLSPRGVQIYKHLATTDAFEAKAGGGLYAGGVKLTPAKVAHLRASAAAAAKQLHPHVQATPEPKVLVQPLPRNFSARPTGVHYLLLVAHDTESPNAPGIADLEAIKAWFSNPNAQASANYVDDAQGNTLEMVNPATLKAWHVAYFNPWAIGVEQVGYASQTRWPLLQVEATARIFAHDATLYGIPIQRGRVSGCSIVKPGIVFHADLGLCGGGHHDPGVHYPLGELIRLTRLYAHAKAPVNPKPKHHHTVKTATVPAVTFHQGMSGHGVRLLQKALNRHGAHLKVDADFGRSTFAAVEAFQEKHHLSVDGVVGPVTRRYLNS
jgi:N-acetyl-anhydromuramyl-L-alanine amidase AmpD